MEQGKEKVRERGREKENDMEEEEEIKEIGKRENPNEKGIRKEGNREKGK